MLKTIGYFLGTHEDWGGASRALLNFVRGIDRKRFRPLVILTKQGNLSASLSNEGIDWVIRSKHDRSRNITRYALDIADSCRFLKRHDIDLIHMNSGAIGWKPAEILAARLVRIPILTHLHMVDPQPSSFLRYSRAVVSVSNYVATHSATYGVPTHVIHNVSNLVRFENGRDIRHELGYDESDVLIVFMGVMMRPKGLEMLVEAFTLISDPRARLLLAGAIRKIADAFTESEVASLVAADTRIKYLGYRTDPENLYSTADILVMPSQLEEACAMIMFEAAAAGKPLIATSTGGTPEVIRHGETGLLVDRSDTAGLANSIQMLIDDKQLRLRLGRQARRAAVDEYSRNPIGKMEELYDKVCT